MPILLKLNANYGDEFDCEEFAIVYNATVDQVEKALKQACTTTQEFDEAKEKFKFVHTDNPPELYFGTNEMLDASVVLEQTTIKEITDAQAAVLLMTLDINAEHQLAHYKYPFVTFGTGVLGQIQDHLYTDEE